MVNGARTIGFDLLFAEPEPGAVPAAWLDRLRAALRDRMATGSDAEQILGALLDRTDRIDLAVPR